jgi:two-component system NarL family response regulator
MGALDLTPRQMEVLRLIARGLGNERIADRLRLSPHTIKNHVHNILERLDAKDRAEAVAHAYQRRWLA